MPRLFLFFFFLTALLELKHAKADRIEEPDIIRINGYLLFYAQAADKLVANIAKHGGKIVKNGADVQVETPGNSDVLQKVLALYDGAKESGWFHATCENGISGKGFGIWLNKDKKLIRSLSLCEI
ncbi:MAG: hypothetical protein I8H75_04165 [Myxococcaceae bacterium]|nr:hypothetical protein [Myxococcaceae bacterium]